jgi:hypothetical protein
MLDDGGREELVACRSETFVEDLIEHLTDELVVRLCHSPLQLRRGPAPADIVPEPVPA